MTTQMTGTVVEGALKLDRPVDLPDNRRVRVAIEPLENWRTQFAAGLKRWRALCERRPIRSGGRHFTREELHERH